jgi:hypothetical protein
MSGLQGRRRKIQDAPASRSGLKCPDDPHL